MPRILVKHLPAYGSDELLTGALLDVDPSEYWLGVYIFVPDVGWFARPSNCFSQVRAGNNGSFEADITQELFDQEATQISVIAFRSSFVPPCVSKAETLPFAIDRNAAARVSYRRKPESLRKIRFSGLDWYVKTSVIKTGPGPSIPNYFLDSENNVFVDGSGRLHMRITRCADEWCSSEIFTERALGFGKYGVRLHTDPNRLDANTVIGLFTWSHSFDYNHRELDIEISRWGDERAGQNTQYVVQPYNLAGNMLRFNIANNSSLTDHSLQWERERVQFRTSNGSGQTIQQWSYNNASNIPPNGIDAQFHINFYLQNGQPPLNPQQQEIVLSNFTFTPSAAEVSFGATSVPVTFAQQTVSVPVTSGSSFCSWNLRSDTPWIQIVDPEGIGSGLPRIRVDQSIGTAPRTGLIAIETPNCNVNGNLSDLRVTQEALDCSVRFEPEQVFTDFRAKLETVRVRLQSTACQVAFRSGSPWIQLQEIPDIATSSEGTLLLSIEENRDIFRSGSVEANQQLLPVLQDASQTVFFSTPSPANGCLTPGRKPSIGLFVSSPVRFLRVRVGSPQGPVVSQLEHGGLVMLDSWVEDGQQFYLTGRSEESQPETVQATTKVSMSQDCLANVPVATSVVDGASFTSPVLVSGSIASLFGYGLSGETIAANGELPYSLGGLTIRVNDIPSKMFFVSPNQINFLVPPGLRRGRYLMSLNGVPIQEVGILESAPTLFVVRGASVSVPLGFVTLVDSEGNREEKPLFICEGNPASCRTSALELEHIQDAYFVLYATGLGSVEKDRLLVSVGSEVGEVLFAGPHPNYPGLDQINVRFARGQLHPGTQALRLSSGTFQSNTGALDFR